MKKDDRICLRTDHQNVVYLTVLSTPTVKTKHYVIAATMWLAE